MKAAAAAAAAAVAAKPNDAHRFCSQILFLLVPHALPAHTGKSMD